MGMDNFNDNFEKKQEIDELAYMFVEEGIDKSKFLAKNDVEAALFSAAYDKYKNGLEEENQDIKLSA